MDTLGRLTWFQISLTSLFLCQHFKTGLVYSIYFGSAAYVRPRVVLSYRLFASKRPILLVQILGCQLYFYLLSPIWPLTLWFPVYLRLPFVSFMSLSPDSIPGKVLETRGPTLTVLDKARYTRLCCQLTGLRVMSSVLSKPSAVVLLLWLMRVPGQLPDLLGKLSRWPQRHFSRC